MSNTIRKVASDSDFLILVPLAAIMSIVAIVATTLAA